MAEVKDEKVVVLAYPRGAITNKNAEEFITYYEMGKKVVAKMKSIIEAHCAAQKDGAVKLEDGRKYGHFPKTSKSIGDISALIEALMAGAPEDKVDEMRAKIMEAMTLSQAKAKPLAKEANVNLADHLIELPANGFGVLPGE